MRLFIVALLVLLAAAPATFARADDAASLMAKHRMFVGWESGVPGMEDQIYTEHQTVTGQGKTFRNDGQIRRHDLFYRETIAYGSGGGADEGFNGRMFWSSNRNGYVHPQLGARAETAYDYNLIMDEAVTLIPNPELRGPGSVAGTPVTVLRVRPPNTLPMDVYEDASGAFKRVVIDPDGTKQVLDVLQYIDAGGGHKMIGEYRWGSGPSWKIDGLRTNVRLTPADVSPPAPQATWTFTNDRPVPLEFDSHTYNGNAIVVKAVVNGHEGRFLIDSGASDIFISDDFAERAGLQARSKTSFSGIASHASQASTILIDTLEIGGNTLHHVYATRGTTGMHDTDGILGYDLLAGAVVDVDLNRHTVTFHDPNVYRPVLAKGAYGFPVDLATLTPGVTVTLPGNLVAHPIFDTGDDFFMMLPERLRQSGHIVGLDDTLDTDYGSFTLHRSFQGVDGAIGATNCMRLQSIQVGPYTYSKAPLCFIDSSIFGDDGGLIGFDFLKHFNWTFDYPANMVILTPNDG